MYVNTLYFRKLHMYPNIFSPPLLIRILKNILIFAEYQFKFGKTTDEELSGLYDCYSADLLLDHYRCCMAIPENFSGKKEQEDKKFNNDRLLPGRNGANNPVTEDASLFSSF